MEVDENLGVRCSECGTTVEPDDNGFFACGCGRRGHEDMLVHRYILPSMWDVVDVEAGELA